MLPMLTLENTTLFYESIIPAWRERQNKTAEKPSREQVNDKCLQEYEYQTKQNFSLHPQYGNREALFMCKATVLC